MSRATDDAMVGLVDECLGQWREMAGRAPTRGDLVAFHSRHKFLILAHDEPCYRRLGRLVAAPRAVALGDTLAEYGDTLRSALARSPTRGSHVNVLQHLAGMCKRRLTRAQHSSLTDAIAAYAAGQRALDAVRVALAGLAQASGCTYVASQSYLVCRERSSAIPRDGSTE